MGITEIMNYLIRNYLCTKDEGTHICNNYVNKIYAISISSL